MKKTFLIAVAFMMAASLQAQSQLSTVRGKTKDGKMLSVQYYQGTVEASIISVKYQLVDELEGNIKTLQGNVRDLQNRLEAANKQIKQLNGDLERSGEQMEDNAGLQQQLAKQRAVADSLSQSINNLNVELRQANDDKTRLQKQIEQLQADMLTQQEKYNAKLPEKTPVVGIEAGLGTISMVDSLGGPWKQNFTLSKHAAVYFGTPRLLETFPISVEAGVGIRNFAMSAQTSSRPVTYTHDEKDVDDVEYQAIYTFNRLSERLELTYLDIPIRICFGQPAKDRTTVYAKIGVTPSININQNFVGEGKYGKQAFYPEWGLQLENIEELGLSNDIDAYKVGDDDAVSHEIAKFNLWGNVAFGACVPLRGTHVVLKAGVKADFPIMGIGTTQLHDDAVFHKLDDLTPGLLGSEAFRVVIPSLEIGVVYTLK